MPVCSRKAVSGRKVHHDQFPASPSIPAIAAPAKGFQLARKGDLVVALDLGGAGLLTPPLTEPPGDLEGFLRAQELVDPIRAKPGGRRDLTDRQRRVMASTTAQGSFLGSSLLPVFHQDRREAAITPRIDCSRKRLS